MTIDELKKADEARRRYEQARHDRESLKGFAVVGILVDRTDPPHNPIKLASGSGGTGSVGSIGYPNELAFAMSAALEKWTDDRVEDAKKQLADYGISDLD